MMFDTLGLEDDPLSDTAADDPTDYAAMLDTCLGGETDSCWDAGEVFLDAESDGKAAAVALLEYAESRGMTRAQLRMRGRLAALFPVELRLLSPSWSYFRAVRHLAATDIEAACAVLETATAEGWTVAAMTVYLREHHGRDPRGRKSADVPPPDLASTLAAYLVAVVATDHGWVPAGHREELVLSLMDAGEVWADGHDIAVEERRGREADATIAEARRIPPHWPPEVAR